MSDKRYMEPWLDEGLDKKQFQPFKKKKREAMKIPSLVSPTSMTMYFYCMGLRSVISAGIPVIRAFELMAESTSHSRLKKASMDVSICLAKGIPIVRALKAHSSTFSPVFITIFMSGLKSGNLDKCLTMLIEHYLWKNKLKNIIIKTIAYPSINLILFAVIIAAKDVIIHVMGTAFKWHNIIQILLPYISMVAGPIFLAFIFSKVLKDKRVRYYSDSVFSFIPFLGEMYRNYSLAVFFKLLAFSLETGQNTILSFRDALKGLDNYFLKKRMKKAEHFLESGESMLDSLSITGCLSPQAKGMIGAGEASGSMPELMEKIAEYYFHRIKSLVPFVMALLTPILLFCMVIAFLEMKFHGDSIALPTGIFSMSLLLFMTT
jgi:type IV pilus assembly protein PilC